jgi:transcriptional antiterminator RfaH
MGNWYLACHKAGKHNAFKAQMFLSQPKIDVIVFIPQICSYRPRADRPGQFKKLIEPLFPGYMFIYFDPEITHTSEISTCPGVSHLVRFADTIKPLHDSIVEEIMKLPVCVHSPIIKERKNKNLECKNKPLLTTAHHEKLVNAVTENNGLTRSALFYAFAESLL